MSKNTYYIASLIVLLFFKYILEYFLKDSEIPFILMIIFAIVLYLVVPKWINFKDKDDRKD